MPSCVVKWCKSHTDMKNSGISFHKFPTNEIQRKKWITAVRLERNETNWTPCKNSTICSIHFQKEDMYALENGSRVRLKKSALPICTMVTPLNVHSNDFLEPSSTTCTTNLQKESSVPREDVKNKANLRELHSPNCSNIEQRKRKLEKTTDKVNICNKMHEKNNKEHDLEEPGCSYMEEKKIKKVECPNCEHKFYIANEILENKASLSASEKLKPSCSTPISVPSPEIESAFNSPQHQKLKKELDLKKNLANKRLFKIKILQRQNKRQKKKILSMKYFIENLKKNGFGHSNLHTALSGFSGVSYVCCKKAK
uniref:THAP-type domain-containing protein n=1 Tax=Bombyx mori TaxID=7091 RepID=A0A8R1WLA5_BOMMO|nr:uncharacterized protein LOC101737731 [Bombyx mori]